MCKNNLYKKLKMQCKKFSTNMCCNSVILMQRCEMFGQSDSSNDDDEELAGIAEGLTPVDISDESDDEFYEFYDE